MINGNNFFNRSSRLKVLVAPLDWGLGHATRCIPIIKHLLLCDIEVIITASDQSYFLLKKEFPNLKISRINGYKIRYSNKKNLLLFKLLIQIPKVFFAIKKENFWLKNFIKRNKIDAVISDNRLGMYNKKIISVYVTHQLLIKTGNKISEKFFQKLHYYFIKKYNFCWIPDDKEKEIAGELSHPKSVPSNVVYIGALSRFELINNVSQRFNVTIIISGPEPQRTIFEQKIISQIKDSDKKILLIRGLPHQKNLLQINNDSIIIYNHLLSEELNKVIQESEIVISRSGYTTIMDLFKINKNAILVPTPGQTEQEYLAKYLMRKKYFYTVDQNNFFLKDVIENFKKFPFETWESNTDQYKKIIDQFVESIREIKSES